jgi:hypothetical protein
MPQPFKRGKREVHITPAAVIHRPHLAVGIANVAANWNKLEDTLGLMYTYILHGKEKTAFEIYHSLISMDLRKTAFMHAAKDKLSKELLTEIENLYVSVRKLAKTRNHIIHATWAYSDAKPMSLLLAQPKDLAEKINGFFQRLSRAAHVKGAPKMDITHAAVSESLTPDSYLEYTHRDFEDVVKRIIALDTHAFALANKVLARALELLAAPPDP